MKGEEIIALARIAWRQWDECGRTDPLPPFCKRGVRLLHEERELIIGPDRLLKAVSGEEQFFEELPAGFAAVRMVGGSPHQATSTPLFMVVAMPQQKEGAGGATSAPMNR